MPFFPLSLHKTHFQSDLETAEKWLSEWTKQAKKKL